MFLKTLSIAGYGPFVEEVTIDFTLLYFFVIQGENGSGKTTLLDALYFALWGESRKSSIQELIPESASYCRVKLDFEMSGKKITIVRQRKAKQSQTFDALEIDNQGEIQKITQSRAITRYIEEELGLRKEWISQVFLIEQGQFDRILESGKKETRDAILQSLCGKIFEETRKKIIEMKNQKEIEEQFFLGKYLDFDEKQCIENQQQEKDKLQEMKQKEIEWTKQKEIIEQEWKTLLTLQQKYQEYEKLKKDLEDKKNLEKTKIEEHKKIEKNLKIIDILPLFEDIEKLKKEIQETEIKIKEITEKQKQNESIKKEKEQKLQEDSTFYEKLKQKTTMAEEIKQLKRIREEKKEEYQEKQEEREKILQEIEKIKKKIKEKQEILENKQQEFKKEEETKQALHFSIDYLEKLRQNYLPYIEYKKLKTNLLEKEKQLEKIQKEIKTLYPQKEKIREELKEIEKKENSLLQQLKNDFASFIRNQLKDGDTCPVCLHTYHASASSPPCKETAEIEKTEQNIQILQRQKEEIKSQLQKIVFQIENNENQENTLLEEKDRLLKEKQEKENFLIQNFPHFPFDLELELKKQEAEEKKQKQIEENQKNLEKIIHQLELEIKHLLEDKDKQEKSKEKIEKELQEIIEKGKTIKEQILQKLENLGILSPDIEKTQEYINDFYKKLEEKELEIKKINEEIKNLEVEEAGLTADLLNKQELLKKNNETLTTKETQWNQKLQQNQIQEEEIRAFSHLDTNMTILQKQKTELEQWFFDLKNLEEKVQQLDQEARVWEKKLSQMEEIAQQKKQIEENLHLFLKEKGKIEQTIQDLEKKIIQYQKDKEKIEKLKEEKAILSELASDFESHKFPAAYITLLLETIIEDANRYFLSRILNSRYSLIMKQNEKGAMDKFEVKDEFENKIRSVETLSGGEKFLLSFALALSFSKIMGEKIGFFFIDEGFGSLDENNRLLLNEIFDLLSNEKQRKIGIITHIAEIAEQIPQKIKIYKKNEKESRVEVKI